MLFATAFLPMFGIGGLTGLPLAFNAVDLYLHDTYYVIGHFHYIVAPGTIFALFAGIYYWYPKVTGRMMSEFWGKVHFWPSLVFMNGIFLPMFLQGMAGVHRRWYDGGQLYGLRGDDEGLHWMNMPIDRCWGLGLSQVPFIFNLFFSIKHGKKSRRQSVGCHHTLEWDAPAPCRARQLPPARLTAGPTNTASRARNTITSRSSCRGANRGKLTHRSLIAIQKQGMIHKFPRVRRRRLQSYYRFFPQTIRKNGNPLHTVKPPGHRPLECQGRHLAVSRVGSDALRRAVLHLHHPALDAWSRLLGRTVCHKAGRHHRKNTRS